MKQSTFFFLLAFFVLSIACNDKVSESSQVSNPTDYVEYISFLPNAPISVMDNINLGLVSNPDNYVNGQEIPTKAYDIFPKIKGTMTLKNGTLLSFQPEQKLNPATEYTIQLKLNNLFKNVDNSLATFSFIVKTITPNIKIDISELHSYNKTSQYLNGVLITEDYIDPDKLDKILVAQQDGKSLDIVWTASEEAELRHIPFKIDNIERKEEDSSISLSWDGSIIGSSNKGSYDFPIPNFNEFKLLNVQLRSDPSKLLTINFSDPIDPTQDFTGLISIEGISELRYEVEGNLLNAYIDNATTGEHNVHVYAGIKNIDGVQLGKNYSQPITFRQMLPQVELISKGTILPNSKNNPIYFKSVNLSAVDVRIVEIYKENVLQFLQSDDLSSTNDYFIRSVGRKIAQRTIHFEDSSEAMSSWKARAINLSDFFEAESGSIYQIEISFRQEYSLYNCDDTAETSINPEIEELDKQIRAEREEEWEEQYWNNERYDYREYYYDWENRNNPCHIAYYSDSKYVTTNVLGSDLGLIVKKGTDKSFNIFSTNLLTGDIEPNTTIQLYDYQQQLIETLTTGNSGKLTLNSDRSVAFVVAKKHSSYAYAKVNDGNSLSMSKFNVSGYTLEKGLQGFIYTERGVYRPGDTIHLTFVLNDKENPLPEDVPIKLEVTNAVGKLVQQEILTAGTQRNDARSQGRFYYFPIPTQDGNETGNWRATISAGSVKFDARIRVATIKPNRLKINMDFAQQILDATKQITGTITGAWLHGAPARNLKYDIKATISEQASPFPEFKGFEFSDPARNFYTEEITFSEGNLDNQGKAVIQSNINIGSKAPGMLKATFLTTLHEGGGDFSMDVYSKDLSPYSHFVGIKPPESKSHGSYFTDEDIVFDVQSVDAQGKSAPTREIEVQVYKVEWRWWWSNSYDNLSKYENSSVYKPVREYKITTDQQGKSEFKLNIPEDERGRYLIRIKDIESGHTTGTIKYFIRDWYSEGSSTADNATTLIFNTDKESYKVNEEAKVRFPSMSNGRALISIENGTKVLHTQWVNTTKGETSVNIPITADMAPNVYINISLLQPHAQTKNDLPIRLYGVIPLRVENPQTILIPEIKMPAVLKPNETFTVNVSEKNKKAMTYTLAVVDDGLLDLTRFKTPDIHGAFNVFQALGVKTFDIYDDVMGAYSGSMTNIYEIGGDDAAGAGKKQKANRFIPVVKHLGPFYLKEGESKSHKIKMPNYIGSVRTMVVAGDVSNSAFGKAEQTTPVKKPLMVLASVPRKLSPGETVTIPVTVFAMENKIKNVNVTMQTGDGLEALTGSSQNIQFDSPDEKIVNFTYKVRPTDQVQSLVVNVSGNGEKGSYALEFDIINPNPFSHTTTDYKIEASAEQDIAYSPYGVPGSSLVKLNLSTIPPMNISRRIQYLIHYPHGCVEQTTSAGFPQLFLPDISDLTADRVQELEKNVKATIKRLGEAQLLNGAFPFWPGNSRADSWATSYAGHFMLEAEKKGYALPISFASSWVSYQRQVARSWSQFDYNYDTTIDQAYRLYTLALAGQPELAAMNRLRTSGSLNNEAVGRLAAAYALAGKEDIAKELLSQVNLVFEDNQYDYLYYSSPIRKQAMLLETMVLLKDDRQRELATDIANTLSSDKWLSTQSTSYALMSMSKMVNASGGSEIDVNLTINGKKSTVKTSKSISEIDLPVSTQDQLIHILNNKSNIIYATVYREGKLPLGSEIENSSKLGLSTAFYDGNGDPLDINKLRQGTEVEAVVKVSNTSGSFINDLTLSQIFPSGWEIINTSFTELEGGATGNANYIDIRDDRVYFHFDLDKGVQKEFRVKLNASYIGKYYLPGTYVDAMYDNSYFAQGKGKWVEIYE